MNHGDKMRFATIGSVIGGDIIAKAIKKNINWHNACSFVSFNPLAIVDSLENDILSDDIFSAEPTSNRETLRDDLNGNILNKLGNSNIDYILVDLSDMRIPERIIEMENGKKIYFTKRNISAATEDRICAALNKKYGCSIKSDTLRTIAQFTDDELKNRIEVFLFELAKAVGKEKIIIFKPKLATQCVDNGNIIYTPNFAISGNTNKLIDRIYSLIPQEYKYIDSPQNIIGDSGCLSPFEYHFCEPYYDYIIGAISSIIQHKSEFPITLRECEDNIYDIYSDIFCKQLCSRIANRLEKNIVIMSNHIFAEKFSKLFNEMYDKKVLSHVEYNACTTSEDLIQTIERLNGQYEDLFFIIPEIHRSFNLIRQMTILNFSYGIDYIVYEHKEISLADFQGVYEDIYNNSISTTNKIKSIILRGCGASLTVGTKSKITKILLYSSSVVKIGNNYTHLVGHIRGLWGGEITIGSNTEVVGGEIDVSACSRIFIGDDCLFSSEEHIISGDGHAIFEIIDAENKKTRLKTELYNDSVYIGNHVWIGYAVRILGGARIEDGSIVGLGSIVNKKFPNNCIIAGVPAKIVKKNIAWARNVFLRELEKDSFVYENFVNYTSNCD